MIRPERSEERFAELVLRQVLRIDVTQRDDGSAPRMPDALFVLPDGTEGALEVTTIGEREALEREAIAAKREWHVDGAQWAWMVHVGGDVVMRELEKHLATLVLECERHSVRDPRALPESSISAGALRWLDSCDVSMHGFPETSRPGAIDVLPEGGGGAVFEHVDELPSWLAARLLERDLIENVDKLIATGRRELHLFLRVHDTAMPFSLYYPLAFGSSVPAGPLEVPPGLTGLWLAPAWKNPILWWSATSGWGRTQDLE